MKLVAQWDHWKEMELKFEVMLNMEREKCVGMKMVLEKWETKLVMVMTL